MSALLLATFTAASAVQASSLQSPVPRPRFAAEVEVVRLNVLVHGKTAPVLGLGAADFEVRDNGVRQRVEHVSHEAMPVNLLLVLDVSGSVAGEKLGAVKRASLDALAGLRAGDRAALLTFADTVRLRTPLGADMDLIRRNVGGLEAEGGTSLRDGVFSALALGDGAAGRVLAIVFTDGGETVSWLPEAAVLDAAKRTDVVVYGVRIEEEASPFLRRVASVTGGRILDRASSSRLADTFVAILDEFRSRYVLSYTPVGVARRGWHRVAVRLRGRPAQVTVREGYAVP